MKMVVSHIGGLMKYFSVKRNKREKLYFKMLKIASQYGVDDYRTINIIMSHGGFTPKEIRLTERRETLRCLFRYSLLYFFIWKFTVWINS